jgi:hypothetical protein
MENATGTHAKTPINREDKDIIIVSTDISSYIQNY